MRDPMILALDAELTGAVVTGSVVEIAGFGTFKTRTYKAYDGRDPFDGAVIPVPEKQITAFTPAVPLYERIANRTSDRLAIGYPAIVDPVVARTGASASAVITAFDDWIHDLLARLPGHHLGLPLGAVGLFRIVYRPERHGRNPQTGERVTFAERWVMEFSGSRCVSVRSGGSEVRGYLDADQVASVLARYAASGATGAGEASQHGGIQDTSDAVRAIERHSKRSIPPLLGVLLGRGSLRLIDDARLDWVVAGSPDQRGTPFARSPHGNWWYLDYDATGDPRILQGDESVDLASWVTACLIVDELDTLAGGRILSESDMCAVLAYLETLSRSAAIVDLLDNLPY